MKHLFKNPLFYVCLILFLAVGFLVVDFVGATTSFSEPTELFPGGNPELPIDTSSNSQIKEAGLTVDELIITPAGNTTPLYLNGSGICMKEGVLSTIACKNYWDQIIKWSNATDGIYYSGKVGIATTTPNYTLDVAGDINLSGTLYQNGSKLQTGYWGQTESDIYYNSGKVGIGTPYPTQGLKLDVEGKVGATEYCDEDGNNCVPSQSVRSSELTRVIMFSIRFTRAGSFTVEKTNVLLTNDPTDFDYDVVISSITNRQTGHYKFRAHFRDYYMNSYEVVSATLVLNGVGTNKLTMCKSDNGDYLEFVIADDSSANDLWAGDEINFMVVNPTPSASRRN